MTNPTEVAEIPTSAVGVPSEQEISIRAHELYLERGADALKADAERWATPLAWATKRGHHEIVQLLRSRGAGT